MKTIRQYMHKAYGSCDHGPAVDPRPGAYYVSVQDGGRRALLAGPYPDHATALGLVDTVREIATNLDPRGCWYAYGTARMHDGEVTPPGSLNDRMRKS